MSADGTRIVKANEVIVVKTDGSAVSWPSEAFRNEKILVSDELVREKCDHSTNSPSSIEIEYVRRELRHNLHIQILFKDCRPDGSQESDTRLVTHEIDCPKPLPDGGRPYIGS